ncbi:hypothetical protein TNCV_2623001 [Trichonephila clavipes]|nr:hypothetical protein TNCV_2623001 [Trichonephila clavipes]
MCQFTVSGQGDYERVLWTQILFRDSRMFARAMGIVGKGFQVIRNRICNWNRCVKAITSQLSERIRNIEENQDHLLIERLKHK